MHRDVVWSDSRPILLDNLDPGPQSRDGGRAIHSLQTAQTTEVLQRLEYTLNC